MEKKEITEKLTQLKKRIDFIRPAACELRAPLITCKNHTPWCVIRLHEYINELEKIVSEIESNAQMIKHEEHLVIPDGYTCKLELVKTIET